MCITLKVTILVRDMVFSSPELEETHNKTYSNYIVYTKPSFLVEWVGLAIQDCIKMFMHGLLLAIFMVHMAISMIAFHWVESILADEDH